MSLFQRQPQAGPAVQLYTLGQHKTILIVGLGNVGREFDGTRHNAGFICLDAFVASSEPLGQWSNKKDFYCYEAKGVLGGAQVICIKPTTLMNLSGKAVQAISLFYKIPPDHVIVVHDELDVPFGQVRLRTGGGAAGHNGIKSVSNAIGEDYGRIRIGIGPKSPPEIDSADYVLQRFTQDETAQLKQLTREVTAILTEYIFSGQLPNETRSFLV